MLKLRKIYMIILLYFCFQNSSCDLFTRTYAGGKNIEDCLNYNREPSNPYQQTTDEKIIEEGYTSETHLVLTSDGYLLPLFRIPGPEGAVPILLQHGLTLNSWYWTANGKDKALPFFLADKGYDVWMGNFRGSIYTRCHTNLTDSDRAYWDFSYHEMGVYDLPPTIDYIVNMTNSDIHFVGHSLGTTAFYVLAIERPDVASKVKVSHNFGPTAFLTHMKGLTTLVVDTIYYTGPFIEFLESGDVFKILENNIFRYLVYDWLCGIPVTKRICELILFENTGFDPEQLDVNMLPAYFNHFPTGASVKTAKHYSQVRQTGRFSYYDYGAQKNQELYGSVDPPDYNFSSIQVPMALYKGANDNYCNLKDVDHLANLLPNIILNYLIEFPAWNHLDFVEGLEARKYVYEKFLSVLEEYK